MIRLVLHHARKDLRGVGWWLALWLALLAAGVVLTLPSVDLALLRAEARPPAAWALLLSTARVVLGMLVVVGLVHADPPQGTTGFWLTRPVPARAVLGAKLLVVAALVFTAAAVNLAALLANSLEPSAIPGVFLEIALFEALPLLPLAVAASLTRDTARMVLAGLACFVVYAGGRGLAISLTEFATGVRFGAGVLLLGLTVLGCSLVCLGAQYLARQRRKTASLALAGLGLAGAVGAVAPFRPVNHAVTTAWPAARAVDLRITSPVFFGTGSKRFAYGSLQLEGVPPGVVVRPKAVDARLRFADGRDVRFQEELPWEAYTIVGHSALDTQVAAAAGHALGAQVFHAEDSRRVLLLAMDRDGATARGATVERYEATLELASYRLRLAASVPARPGARATVASADVTVVSSAEAADVRSLVLRLAEPALAFRPSAGLEFLLLNRSRREAMPGMLLRAGRRESLFSLQYVLAPLRTLAFSTKLPGPTERRLDDEWFDQAELAVVTVKEEGVFRKRVAIESFQVR